MTDKIVRYDVTQADIQATREAYAALSADTPEGYEEVRLALANLRGTRTAIEKRRVELKAEALAFGRQVDGVAKALTNMLSEIEEPLREKKAAVDDAKERAAAEKLRIEREAQEAAEKALRDAEEARIKEERARLQAEQAAFAEVQRVADEKARAEAETNRIEREALEAERRAFDDQRLAGERAEAARLAKIKAEADAAAKAERDRLAAAEKAERDRKWAEAIRPDVEKVLAFAEAIRALARPDVSSTPANDVLEIACIDLDNAASVLENFGQPKRPALKVVGG